MAKEDKEHEQPSKKHLNRFSSTNQPKNRGRKKSIATILKGMDGNGKICNMTKADYEAMRVRVALQFIEAWNATRSDTLRKLKDPSATMGEGLINQVIAKAAGKGDCKALMQIMEKVFGFRSNIDITTNGKDMVNEPLTIEIIDNRDKVSTDKDNG